MKNARGLVSDILPFMLMTNRRTGYGRPM